MRCVCACVSPQDISECSIDQRDETGDQTATLIEYWSRSTGSIINLGCVAQTKMLKTVIGMR